MNLKEQLLALDDVVSAKVTKNSAYKGQETWAVEVMTALGNKAYTHNWEFVRKFIKPDQMLEIIKSYLRGWENKLEERL